MLAAPVVLSPQAMTPRVRRLAQNPWLTMDSRPDGGFSPLEAPEWLLAVVCEKEPAVLAELLLPARGSWPWHLIEADGRG